VIKAWWLDSSDPFETSRMLNAAKDKHRSWDWIRVEESGFDSAKEAQQYFLREIQMRPMFSDGKAVYCFGLPSFHAEIAKAIPDIPSRVLMVVVAKPDRTTSLWKKIKEMGSEDSKVTEFEELTKANSVKWIKERAQTIGLQMEDVPCMALADMVGFDKGRLHGELLKLLACSPDSPPSVDMVQSLAHGTGMIVPFEMNKAILAKDGERATECLERLLSKENPEQICGLIRDFFTRMALAASCSSVEETKQKASGIVKTVDKKVVPFFSNPNSLYYSYKDANESGWSMGGINSTLEEVIRTNLAMRSSGLGSDLLLRYLVCKASNQRRV